MNMTPFVCRRQTQMLYQFCRVREGNYILHALWDFLGLKKDIGFTVRKVIPSNYLLSLHIGCKLITNTFCDHYKSVATKFCGN